MSWLDEIDDAPIIWEGTEHTIEDNVHIGYNRLSKLREGYKPNSPVKIGNNVHIRTGTVIYAGCEIGDNVHIGHNVVLREFTKIGNNSSIGSDVVCEGYTTIGHHTTVHAQTHLTAKLTIGNYCFIGPNVTTMNDRRVRYYRPDIEDSPDQGATIEDGVIIGSAAVILPAIKIGKGCIIAAGAIVTKDCEPFFVYIGVPAKKFRHINNDEVVKSLQNDYDRFIAETYFTEDDGH